MKHATKTATGLALAAALAAGPAGAASASGLETLGNGAESGGVLIADAGQGSTGGSRGGAARSDGGGGSFWEWGVGVKDTWSNYFREKRCHGATAVGLKTARVSNVPGGKYAKATTPKARTGNKAHYHNC